MLNNTKNKAAYLALSLVLFVLVLSCAGNGLFLPGQSKAATKSLTIAVNEMEKEIGKPIEFDDIASHPQPSINNVKGILGASDIGTTTAHVWLDSTLTHDNSEIIAAHELGHIHQQANTWALTASPQNANNQAVFPELALIGSEIASMIQDAAANEWAEQHGFPMGEYLKTNVLEINLKKDLSEFKPSGFEADDWTGWINTLYKLAGNLKEYENSATPILINRNELITVRAAIFYAKIHLTLAPYNLASAIDQKWKQELPIAQGIGQSLVNIIEKTGFDTKTQNDQALVEILTYLNIPTLYVVEPDTMQVVWPN